MGRTRPIPRVRSWRNTRPNSKPRRLPHWTEPESTGAPSVASFEYAANGFSAALTPAEAESLAAQKRVLSVQRDELRQLHTSESPDFLGLDDRRVHAPAATPAQVS